MLNSLKDIKDDEYYRVQEICVLLSVHESTIIKKCQSEEIKAKNVGTGRRATWRILGSNLKDYLNK